MCFLSISVRWVKAAVNVPLDLVLRRRHAIVIVRQAPVDVIKTQELFDIRRGLGED